MNRSETERQKGTAVITALNPLCILRALCSQLIFKFLVIILVSPEAVTVRRGFLSVVSA